MSDLRQRLVAEAETWEGTPFTWQQAVKGKGCDCKGLIVGIASQCGRPEAISIHALEVGDFRGRVPCSRFRKGLAALFDKVPGAEPGDILLLRLGGKAQHLAMYLGGGRMIHCYATGKARVQTVAMGRAWWSAIDSIWSWRDADS